MLVEMGLWAIIFTVIVGAALGVWYGIAHVARKVDETKKEPP